MTADDADDAVTESASEEAAIDRRQVLRAAGGVALGGTVLSAPAGAERPKCEDCVFLGKVDGQPSPDDSYEFEYGDRTITIDVEEVGREDGEVVWANYVVEGGGLCKVIVKGGPFLNIRRFERESVSITPTAPTHVFNPNRDYFAISYVAFYLCLTEGDEVVEDRDTGATKPSQGRDGKPTDDRGKKADKREAKGDDRKKEDEHEREDEREKEGKHEKDDHPGNSRGRGRGVGSGPKGKGDDEAETHGEELDSGDEGRGPPGHRSQGKGRGPPWQ